MGEPFRAEIDLLNLTQFPDSRTTVTPRLASPEIYPPLGFRYNPALTGARLNIQSRANGRHVLELVSLQPLNEPFVYLLVELESDAARIVRGYTALLDPPGYRAPRQTAAVEYLPAVVPPTVTAGTPVAVRAPALDRPAVARPAPRQDVLSNTDAKTLAAMLDRVAALEAAVAQLQRQWEKTKAVAAVKSTTEASPAANPEAVKAPSSDTPAEPAAAPGRPAVAAPSPPPLTTVEAALRPAPVKDSLLNEALLALVIGLLIISAWLSWVVWGPPSREQAPERKPTLKTSMGRT